MLRRALALHETTKIPVEPYGLQEIVAFEKYLKVQVVVISTAALNNSFLLLFANVFLF